MAIAAVGGGTAGLVNPIGAPGLDARVALATTHMQVGADDACCGSGKCCECPLRS